MWRSSNGPSIGTIWVLLTRIVLGCGSMYSDAAGPSSYVEYYLHIFRRRQKANERESVYYACMLWKSTGRHAGVDQPAHRRGRVKIGGKNYFVRIKYELKNYRHTHTHERAHTHAISVVKSKQWCRPCLRFRTGHVHG